MPNELGQKLKKYREAAFPEQGLRHVANLLGIDYSYLYRIEDGQHTPSDEKLAKIGKSYRLSVNQQLELFNLAHSTHFHEVIHKALKQDDGTLNQVFAFNRKKKK